MIAGNETGNSERPTKESPPYFLTAAEYALVGAIAETFVPSGADAESDPGAKEVGARNYIDSELLNSTLNFRREVIETLDIVEKKAIEAKRKSFAALSYEDRSSVLSSLLYVPQLRARIVELRSLCLEGFYSDYCDPGYTGKTAWDWVEYQGKRISDLKKDWSFLRIHNALQKKDQG